MTKKELLKLNPCREGIEFAESCDFDFVKIWQTCERGDWLIWLLRNTGQMMTKPVAVEIAIACALHVIEQFEAKHPHDKRPRKAIEAAQSWLKEPTEANRNAAAAYAAAAVAAAAAYTAAYTAYAAAAAAAATGDAAAAYTAAATGDAAGDERKWQADKIRELIECPFKC